jgi:hypothetical protein
MVTLEIANKVMPVISTEDYELFLERIFMASGVKRSVRQISAAAERGRD